MKNFKAQYILNGVLFAIAYFAFFYWIGTLIPFGASFIYGIYKFALFVGFFAIIVHSLWECDERTPEEYEELLKNRFLPVRFPKTMLFVVLLSIGVQKAWIAGGEMKKIYNTNVVYTTNYAQKTQAIAAKYDYFWKTKKEKAALAGINKDAFFEITDIIFSHRADGANVAWKWLQENQPVPYAEFTKFYAELSDFTQASRDEIYKLELERQNIVKEQNTLLGTFPNNQYNRLLQLDKLEYVQGISSDSTQTVIQSGKENL